MVQYSDEHWYQLLLARDPVSRALTSEAKSIIIRKSMQAAELQKKHIGNHFGKRTGAEYLRLLGFELAEEERALMPSFLYFGLMEPEEKKVYINQAVLNLTERYIRTCLPEQTGQLKQLRDIVCFHELYHVIEECTSGIYTRNVRISQTFLQLIPYRRRVEAASEIGAIHFSKLMSNADFSPYVYTQYAAAAVNTEFGSDE